MPDNVDAEITPRSSALIKHQLLIPKGTIDSNYDGELFIAVFDVAKHRLNLKDLIGLSVAQLIFREKPSIRLVEGDVKNNSIRGAKGFGSTGV